MGTSGNSKKEGKENEDRVVEPREVDILCGRGGLSNHHPGNEWYRRLIRSNRPLYRACPKHTKLLVSKAIVQAVEQQGGRFLERSRKDGFWYTVPYKRAVDKTSQGLRERERDDEGGNEGGGSSQQPMAVPYQFSGQAPHKLSDLADVAIAHATRMDGLPRTPSEMVGASGYRPTVPGVAPVASPPGGAAHAQRGVQPSRPAPVPPPRTTAPAPPHATPQAHRMEVKDFSPLPPTLEPRQSSMFRLLKDTKLLPSESAFIMGPNRPQVGYSRAPAAATKQEEPPVPRTAMYGVSPAPPPYAYGAAPAAAAPAGGAPTLTRLTSQVSDWLNSFWPVPVRGESTAAAPAGGAYPSRTVGGYGGAQQQQQKQPPPPPPKGVAPAIQMVPPPEPPGPIQINTIPPMSKPEETEGQSKNPVRVDKGQAHYKLSSTPPHASYEETNRESTKTSTYYDGTAQQRQSRFKSDKEETQGDAEDTRPSLAPTELEHSVSATLLKLASTPSRFFSGISALFGDDDDTAAPPPVAASTETSASTGGALALPKDSPPPIVAGTKRSKASLLDDDDSDDGGTAAAASVLPAKKRRTSLLDDYEESPRETRMRNVYED